MTLIERLEKAGEGSLALDIELMVLLGGARDVGDGVYYGPSTETWHTSDAAENEGCWMLPAPSRSLDAALALAERVLPGWCVAQIGQGDDRKWFVELREGYRTSFNRVAMSPVGVPTPALALCLAVLRATKEQAS